jgi:hypothetical protein
MMNTRLKALWLFLALLVLSAIPARAQSNTVLLTWTAGANDATYNVLRAPGACSSSSTFTVVNTTPITATTYTDTSAVLASGATAVSYCYEVDAFNSAGAASSPSNQVTAVIPASILPAPPVLAAPTVTPVATPAPTT